MAYGGKNLKLGMLISIISNFLFIGSLDLDSMLKYQNILVFLYPVIGKMQFWPILPFMGHLNCVSYTSYHERKIKYFFVQLVES